MKEIFIINPPDKNSLEMHITKDMAGGFGFNAGSEVILPSLELIYHAITLKRNNYSVKFYDFQAEVEKVGEFLEKIGTAGPCFVLILITTPTLDSDLQFIKKIKDANSATKIFAKFDIKNNKIVKKILDSTIVELVIIGETELTIPEILARNQRAGVAYLENGNIIYGPNKIVENLDTLPDLDLDFLNIQKYRYPLLPLENGNAFTFQSSRGCPFPCAYYCPYPLIQGNTWRAMSEKKLYTNIEILVNKYNVKSILFRDATFTLNRERIYQFCEDILDNNLNFNWWCETRMNCLDEKLLKKMSTAGCHGINLGVETGDDELMRKQGKIGGDIKQLIEIRQLSAKFKIKLHFLMIVGLPEETKDSLYKSYIIIRKLKPESLGVTTITPYPGTKLYQDAVANKWIINRDLTDYIGNSVVMRSKHLNPWQIRHSNFLLRLAGYLNRQKSFPYIWADKFLNIYFFLWSKL
jgi:anaerobic magnesium-protoporphyrin IX monomethyl ester cyclase